MLERFTRERQRASKGDVFNLEDEEELTHYGQSLSKLDDFDNIGLDLEDEDEDRGAYSPVSMSVNLPNQSIQDKSTGELLQKAISADLVTKERTRKVKVTRYVLYTLPDSFGPDLWSQPERKKSKAEVMAELIAKSKEHKVRALQYGVIMDMILQVSCTIVFTANATRRGRKPSSRAGSRTRFDTVSPLRRRHCQPGCPQ